MTAARMASMKSLSLFSGIGGLDLAAESCGIETAAFCEIEPYAVEVLKRRWPGVPIIDDVRKIRGCDWTVDVVHGGFPCQDLSVAGKQAGLEGARSGLWFEMLRVIAECRPAFVLAENVRGAVNLALDTVYAGLVGEGYKVYPYVIPASAVGAPHQRERLFVFGVRRDVADTYAERLQGRQEPGSIYAMRKKSSYEQSGRSGEGGGALWPTPSVHGDYNRAGVSDKSGNGLSTAANLWPTPCSRGDNSGGPVGLAGGTRAKKKLDEHVGEDARKKLCSGSLNPAWVEILMGFPLGWTDLDCDEPEPWPGWPALMGERLWMTPKAGTCGMTAKTKGRPLEMSTHLSAQTFVAERDFADQYHYEPPRTTAECKNRAKRLKCLGNAVVPAQARPFFEAMASIYSHPSYSGQYGNVSRETLLNKIREA